jgi:hypothetical protein
MLEALDDGDLKAAKAAQNQFKLDSDDLSIAYVGRFALVRVCQTDSRLLSG